MLSEQSIKNGLLLLLLITHFFPLHRYLHITGDQFGRPIQGQREVSGYSYPETGNEWKAMVRLSYLSSFQMTVESNNAIIAIDMPSDWLENLVQLFLLTRSKTKTNRTLYA